MTIDDGENLEKEKKLALERQERDMEEVRERNWGKS
jgi:hypothetical protein